MCKLIHSFIAGESAQIEPTIEKAFPNHSAVLTIRMEGKREPVYMAMMRGFDEAIDYCRVHGYIIPVGL